MTDAERQATRDPGPKFRDWLRHQMRARSLGIRQVEAYTGVSRSTISQILRGLNLPSNETVVRLARYFGAETEPLLAMVFREKTGELWQGPIPDESAIDLDDPAERIALSLELLERREEITPDERASIELVVRSILEQSRRRREQQ